MSRFPQPEELKPTPDRGEHTDAILTGLGYGAGDIKKLREKGVI
jgi:crotonobetainyl-CoA:carnitine CoA-transferase CaiB-like acyl-CoA transferase